MSLTTARAWDRGLPVPRATPAPARRAARRLRAAALLGGLALAACAHRAHRENAGPGGSTAWVRIQNQLPDPYTLYVSDGLRQLRAGDVPPLSTTVLRVPPSLVFPATTLVFIARPRGTSAAPVTERLQVTPGDTVYLTLAR